MRQRIPGEERRRLIIESAARLFSQHGFGGTTTREIARTVGVSEATVFGDEELVDLSELEESSAAGDSGDLGVAGVPEPTSTATNTPTETANALRDGWLNAGDSARMDEDGYFYIVDRKKELIKPGGYQVWPREVEEVITSHPKVLEVGVAGVPDAYRGETVKAWVVLKEGETATEEEIRQFCKENMAIFKVPTQIEFRKELPKTTVGKVLRRELVREHMEKGQGASTN